MTCNKRIFSLLLAAVMLVTATLPVFAQELAGPSTGLILVDGEDVDRLHEETTGTPDSETPDDESSDGDVSSSEGEEEAQDADAASSTQLSLGASGDAVSDSGNFILNCTPEQAAELIAFYEYVRDQIENPRSSGPPPRPGTAGPSHGPGARPWASRSPAATPTTPTTSATSPTSP